MKMLFNLDILKGKRDLNFRSYSWLLRSTEGNNYRKIYISCIEYDVSYGCSIYYYPTDCNGWVVPACMI